MTEVRTMAENLLPMLAYFAHGEDLWIVVPFVDNGSVFSILRCPSPLPKLSIPKGASLHGTERKKYSDDAHNRPYEGHNNAKAGI